MTDQIVDKLRRHITEQITADRCDVAVFDTDAGTVLVLTDPATQESDLVAMVRETLGRRPSIQVAGASGGPAGPEQTPRAPVFQVPLGSGQAAGTILEGHGVTAVSTVRMHLTFKSVIDDAAAAHVNSIITYLACQTVGRDTVHVAGNSAPVEFTVDLAGSHRSDPVCQLGELLALLPKAISDGTPIRRDGTRNIDGMDVPLDLQATATILN